MEQAAKTKLVIAGGGTAGWLAAYSLVKRLGKLLDITLVESDQILTVGVGEATVPTMRTFHHLIELDEQEFMKATQATFKLGIKFENWANISDQYIHSFGTIGERSWMAEFHEFWLEARDLGFGGSLVDYCLEWKAAWQHKFATKVNNTQVNYAFHLDATAYAHYLRQKAEALGVQRVEGKIAGADIDSANGNLTRLRLESGAVVDGEVFIDCTGFRSLLLGQYLGVEFEDWSHWLFSNRAIALQTEHHEPPPPYTRAIAHPHGWQWWIPLQKRVGTGIVYCDRFVSDEDARQTLYNNLPGDVITELKWLRFTAGRRRRAWCKNCIGVGLSSGFLEPLESTSIHLITTAITRLMRLFPFSGNFDAQAERFNEETRVELEAVRDFIILHYKLTRRKDTAFWNACRTLDIPDSLAHRMEIFAQNGYVWSDPVGLFRVDSWVQVMMGQGLDPKRHHGASRLLPAERLRQQLRAIEQAVEKNLQALPSHADFIEKYCG